jgi:2-dehydro-3-deoxy-D-arabinonate dehydratase
MKLYRTKSGIVAEQDGRFHAISPNSWDDLLVRDDLPTYLSQEVKKARPLTISSPEEILPPIGNQEVWAAGVTYFRSRNARMEESKTAGGGDFYDRVYHAARPELFFKATAHRVVGPQANVAIRKDASWSVPEPELVLFINASGRIAGYTIGNDMSSRDIEGENLLYLPQAKIYHYSCALGPWIVVGKSEAEAREWPIAVQIQRGDETVFKGETSVGQIKRSFEELAKYLFRSQQFPHGAVLLTGTGVIPPDSFTLQEGDSVQITVGGIGRLRNTVVMV